MLKKFMNGDKVIVLFIILQCDVNMQYDKAIFKKEASRKNLLKKILSKFGGLRVQYFKAS